MKRRERWLERNQYVRNYSVPKDILTKDIVSDYYPPNHLDENLKRIEPKPKSTKKQKVIVDVHSPAYQIEQENKRRKEIMFLKRYAQAGHKVEISQKDADLLNYKEVERQYELKKQEQIRRSKKPRPRDIIPPEVSLLNEVGLLMFSF